MGSSSSKNNAVDSPSSPVASSSSSVVVRRSRSTRSKVFQSACLGSRDSENEEVQALETQTKRNEASGACLSETKSGGRKAEWFGKVKVKKHDETCVASNVELDDWKESRLSDTIARKGDASSRASSSRSSNLSGRFLPRFNFRPGNMSFRLSRANSLGSARSLFASSQRFASSIDEDELRRSSSSGRFTDRNERPQNCDFLPSCFSNRSPSQCSEDVTSNNLVFTPSTANFSDNFTDEPHPASRRGLSAREPTERNISISRTLSVGRLRDRVVRRSSFPDVCSFQRETETGHASAMRQNLGGELSSVASQGNDLILSNSSGFASSGASTSLYGSQYYAVESPRGRETRYHDLLEHRSNWLERRRRIRSQVYALQRLGRRFENHSGHERSCVLSSQHRTGHCTCRISSQGANLDSDSSARASISRIVMLAEALFEVLDEIHQQSVVLSSQPSVSSIGSVPAPNEVVESLPVKSYNKFRRSSNDEVAQCYICLVEYEEGDMLRTLPCHHEFHRTCVDKWLKEIHRVCPLCRGDICQGNV
uniref:RING-type domain-containing protein n=1 Tax=Solanum lycopersicum TaxID=4081 RepID=A0A3Q7HSY2_SOLLC